MSPGSKPELDGRPMLLVPQLDDDVHDIEGLLRMHRYLFASDAERERLIARARRLIRPGGSPRATIAGAASPVHICQSSRIGCHSSCPTSTSPRRMRTRR